MDRETITMMTPHPVTDVNANLLLTNKTDSDLNLLDAPLKCCRAIFPEIYFIHSWIGLVSLSTVCTNRTSKLIGNKSNR